MESVFINLSQRINNLVAQSQLNAIGYISSNAQYKNEKKICYTQSINRLFERYNPKCEYQLLVRLIANECYKICSSI